jgi:hypothetical protein
MVPVKPFVELTLMVDVVTTFAFTVAAVGLALRLKSGRGTVIVKVTSV